MGEADPTLFGFSFNRSVELEGRPERLTADAGVLALRELDERVGFTHEIAAALHDPRRQDLVTHPLQELLRSRLFAMVQGHRDQDDLDRLRDDGAFRLAVSDRRGDAPLRPVPEEELTPDGLASQPTQSRLVGNLCRFGNLDVLADQLFATAVKAQRAMRRGQRVRSLTLDVDSLPILVHGNQVGGEANGHYHHQVFHPLIAMHGVTGDWLDAALRPGSVHTSTGLEEFLLPLVARAERELCQVAHVRADAGMPKPELLVALDDYDRGQGRPTGVPYVFRLSSNPVLERMAEPFLRRPPGRPPQAERVWVHELRYQAKTWDRERRVVLVVVDRPGLLFVEHFFLLTSYAEKDKDGLELLDHYRGRGTMEGRIGELKDVLRPALSSSSRGRGDDEGRDGFAANQANLLLYALAYNLANLLRRVTAAATRTAWSLQRMREVLLRVPARLLLHARRVTVVVRGEVAPLWNAVLAGLTRLRPVAAGPPARG